MHWRPKRLSVPCVPLTFKGFMNANEHREEGRRPETVTQTHIGHSNMLLILLAVSYNVKCFCFETVSIATHNSLKDNSIEEENITLSALRNQRSIKGAEPPQKNPQILTSG